MKFYFLLLSCLAFLQSRPVNAQNKVLKIQGSIDASILRVYDTKQIIIKINDPIRDLTNSEQQYSFDINSSGEFRAEIPVSSKFIYLNFAKLANGASGDIIPINYPSRNNAEGDAYLFQQGDSVNVSISRSGQLYFSGKGDSKLNYQDIFFSRDKNNWDGRITDLYYKQNYKQALILQSHLLSLEKARFKNILETYKGELSDDIFNILLSSTMAELDFNIVKNLDRYHFSQVKNNDEITAYIDEFINLKTYKSDQLNYSSETVYYPKLLFMEEWIAERLISKDMYIGDSARSLFRRIIGKYHGNLRDQILFLWMKNVYFFQSTDIEKMSSEILDSLQTVPYKEAFLAWIKGKSELYPFQLSDISGRVHTPNDYKGKVLVFDTWFTGCGGCVMLNWAMHPIIEKYKERTDIVFLTVSSDKKKSDWLKSLPTGRYTSPWSINLFTDGLGEENPFFKYYNFTGGAHQLIVGKDGRVISSSPPKIFKDRQIHDELYKKSPSKDVLLSNPTSKAFMKILDDALAAM